MENARPAEPGRRWSVDAFIGFWKKPDVSRRRLGNRRHCGLLAAPHRYRPFEFTGCDRVKTRDGHVCENYVFCDDPFFARVAAELGNSRR